MPCDEKIVSHIRVDLNPFAVVADSVLISILSVWPTSGGLSEWLKGGKTSYYSYCSWSQRRFDGYCELLLPRH